ncbi:CU044_5270 family protein [Actinomadura fibrosa]|uniref:CU044_5270 family protein n=1 Tax=Actinomadura fibrosa TaxID=111802 RepID=A0ABW2XMY7_9ACTN|nr:CU044_5270 family protein [Actinomadura fibrosa]
MKHSELDDVLTALKPATIDDLADAARARHPATEIVRAAPRPPLHTRRRNRKRPILLLAATGAATAVAVTAVLASGTLSGGRPKSHDRAAPPPDTRTFLLASAETIAKQPASKGNCWYSRTRMWQDFLPYKKAHGVPIPKTGPKAYKARTASSTEEWACTLPGGTGMRFRTHLPLDVKVTFPTKKDEAAWRAAGSPPLDVNGGTTATKPFTTTYDKGSHLVNPLIGSHEIEWRTLPKLPATERALETHLRKLWKEDLAGGAHGYRAPADFCQYVFVSAWDLFMSPTTPGTRAALYRILAGCPSVRVTGKVKDREGRPGVAIAAGDVRLVVDPATAQLLVFEQDTGPTATEYLAFERQGWVNKLGALPTP